MSVINRNFVVQSLQGVIPPNSYDLIDFDERALQIIAYAVTLDRSIMARCCGHISKADGANQLPTHRHL